MENFDKKLNLTRVPLARDTKEWEPRLDIVSPIDTVDIPGFKAWVNWNDFNLDGDKRKVHMGYDYAAYYTTDGQILFGLPKHLPIRAIADGKIVGKHEGKGDMAYYSEVEVEHTQNDEMPYAKTGLISKYVHVLPNPEIQGKTMVSKGEVIGFLYADSESQEVGNTLVHLHFELLNKDSSTYASPRDVRRFADPGKIFPHLIDYNVSDGEKGHVIFSVSALPGARIINANGFENIIANTKVFK